MSEETAAQEATQPHDAEIAPDADVTAQGVEAPVDDADNPGVATAGPASFRIAREFQDKELGIAALVGGPGRTSTISLLQQIGVQFTEANRKNTEMINRIVMRNSGLERTLASINAQNRAQITALSEAVSGRFERTLASIHAQNRAQISALTQAASAGFAPVYERLFSQLRETALTSYTFPAVQYDFGKNIGSIVEAYAKQHDWTQNIRRLADAWERLIPENLRGLRTSELGEVFAINAEDGTSLAWAPRPDIVRQLLDAPDMATRGTLLVERASEIAEDVATSLDEVVLEEHQELRTMLLDAAKALSAGLYYAAQASACNALDTIMNVRMLAHLAYTGKRSRDLTRNHFRPAENWRDLYMSDLELVLVGGGIATAFDHWTRGAGLPSFNRNGSVHHVDDGSYTPAHAVRALLIAHAALRWLDAAIRAEAAQNAA